MLNSLIFLYFQIHLKNKHSAHSLEVVISCLLEKMKVQAFYHKVWLFLTASVAFKQKSNQTDKEGALHHSTLTERLGHSAVQQ